MKENLGAAELVSGADERIVINLMRPWVGIPAMRALHLDLLVDATPWQRITALHTLLSGSAFSVGFRSAGQFRSAAYDLSVDHSAQLHELENFRALARVLGVEAVAEPAVTVPSLLGQHWVDAWAKATSNVTFCEHDRLIVLHPWPAGAQFWLREWPQEHWITLALALQVEHPDAFFVVTGSPADQPRVQPLLAALTSAGVRATRFSAPMSTLVELLRRASLAVCVNTGILHLAAIVGTPTLGLNGPTADHRWGPRGRCARGVSPADGSGGYLHFGYEYPADPEDVMSRITVDQVLEAARDVMPCGKVIA